MLARTPLFFVMPCHAVPRLLFSAPLRASCHAMLCAMLYALMPFVFMDVMLIVLSSPAPPCQHPPPPSSSSDITVAHDDACCFLSTEPPSPLLFMPFIFITMPPASHTLPFPAHDAMPSTPQRVKRPLPAHAAISRLPPQEQACLHCHASCPLIRYFAAFTPSRPSPHHYISMRELGASACALQAARRAEA